MKESHYWINKDSNSNNCNKKNQEEALALLRTKAMLREGTQRIIAIIIACTDHKVNKMMIQQLLIIVLLNDLNRKNK